MFQHAQTVIHVTWIPTKFNKACFLGYRKIYLEYIHFLNIQEAICLPDVLQYVTLHAKLNLKLASRKGKFYVYLIFHQIQNIEKFRLCWADVTL